MSRIGKYPVSIPSDVQLTVDAQKVVVKGKLGELSFTFNSEVKIEKVEDKVVVSPRSSSRFAQQMWGTARAVIQNMITGVVTGFSKKLELQGVGYRAAMKGSNLELQLGFSHDVIYPIPSDLKVECPSQTEIIISGASKERVGQIASEIRSYRPPEPYKGKGVRYANEFILRKEGKKK